MPDRNVTSLPQPPKTQRGISVVEVMVSALIALSAIGGYMQLFQHSTQSNYEAMVRFRQQLLTQELFELVLANPSQYATLQQALSDGGSNNGCSGGKSSTQPPCTPEQWTQEAAYDWLNFLRNEQLRQGELQTLQINRYGTEHRRRHSVRLSWQPANRDTLHSEITTDGDGS